MENDINTIILNDEDGNEIEFDIITKFDIEDKEYLIVIPTEGEEEEAVALKIEQDKDGNDILVTIENEEEFELVSEAYETLFSESNNDLN